MHMMIVKAIADGSGPDITGRIVPMPAGSYHLCREDDRSWFEQRSDVFSFVTQRDDSLAPTAFKLDASGNATGLVGSDGTYAVLLTLICTAAPVSVTGTTVKTVLRTVAIPDGAMGANSILRIRPIWNYTSSANNKSIGVDIGTAPASVTNIYARTRTTTAADLPLIELQNRNNVASQIIRYSQAGTYATATSSANATSTINFSTSGMNLYIYGTLTNTGETITLESVHVEIINPYA